MTGHTAPAGHPDAGWHQLTVHRCSTRQGLGQRAGEDAATVLRAALSRRPLARVLLAAAPSQLHTLRTLAAAPDLAFDRLELFHMDDYIGLPPDAAQGFANWLEREFLSLLPQRPVFHRMAMTCAPERAAADYATLLGDAPFDLVLCGLGNNAHIAFNDPGSDFEDPQRVRIVEMDIASREQQVAEGHFPDLAAVPTHALTVTIPRVLNAHHLICSVPGAAKQAAVRATLEHPPTPDVPGTALKLRPNVHLYLDQQSDPDRQSDPE